MAAIFSIGRWVKQPDIGTYHADPGCPVYKYLFYITQADLMNYFYSF